MAITRALRDPGLAERFDKEGAEIVGSSPDELAKFQAAETQKWGRIIKSAGIQPE
jgi:tripartite-type tricarboxylate transporter receptor subunit TctC